ncbi:MAG: bifunctional 2-methylcitrate synthase/citrate synthase [Actinobacteria bacterium]|nr:bifunctional 2-methylcitrate synthase/citrate synthase [Actinomycetota bacterium]
MPDQQTHRGLAGVVVDTTAISKVDPQSNSLLYRGYPVQELAARCSVEQVAWLLWHGDLPTDSELADLQQVERAHRGLHPAVRQVIDLLPSATHPMDVVRTAVSVLGTLDRAGSALDADPATAQDSAVRLFAALPAIIAYDQRRRRGLDPVPPLDDLDYASNLLHLTFGTAARDLDAEVLGISMVLYAEHSFNASTFTARVVTSTLSDQYSAVVAAIGALKGPLHGGANEAVMSLLDEVGSVEAVEPWLDAALGAKRKIMGFGHRVYKHGDSRVPTMQAALDRLVADRGAQQLAELYGALAAAMERRTGILPNLDYPSGPAYHLLGFDVASFTPLFVASRVIGWTAHIAEQRAANSLIRPLSAYDGPELRHVP